MLKFLIKISFIRFVSTQLGMIVCILLQAIYAAGGLMTGKGVSLMHSYFYSTFLAGF